MNKYKEKTQVCVIGAGAGGGVVARNLAKAGVKVIVLEVGRRYNPLRDYNTHRTEDQLYRLSRDLFRAPGMDTMVLNGEVIDDFPVGYGIGGTTLIYEAYKVRMEPHDFKTKTVDGVGKDWPITYEEIAPYYRRVEWELRVSGDHNNPWGLQYNPFPNPPFPFSYANQIIKRGCDKMGIRLWPVPVGRLSRPYKERPICNQCGHCYFGCKTGAKSSTDVTYIREAENTKNADIRPECAVTRIETDSKGLAKSVIYFDQEGGEHEIIAQVVILSAGTFHSPRILLNSKNSLFPNGLANSSGQVGKNLMQHIGVNTTAIFPDRVDSYRGFYGGAVSMDFAATNPKNNYARGFCIELTSAMRGPVQMAASQRTGWGLWHKNYMRHSFGHVAGFNCVGEILPYSTNRVELDPEIKDKYGMPVPRITVELHENERMMLKAITSLQKQIYDASNALGSIDMGSRLERNCHNMGTCAMGNDPNDSVLNSYCQTHDIPNLFVVDGSCFVTGGTANPSLTIQAIASRASDYIIKQGKRLNLPV